jgi:lambda repressor-like predicted transcriptional regulator
MLPTPRMVCALFEAFSSSKEQVVVAMVDRSATLIAMMIGLRVSEIWTDRLEIDYLMVETTSTTLRRLPMGNQS